MTGYESKRAAAQDKLAQPAQAEQCSYPDCKCPTENPCLKSLAQPAQELWAGVDFDIKTTPPQRKPLTDEQIEDIAAQTMFPINFARAIEAAHGIKENT
jgi:hypothetical protein